MLHSLELPVSITLVFETKGYRTRPTRNRPARDEQNPGSDVYRT
jgi:hypothetical protein